MNYKNRHKEEVVSEADYLKLNIGARMKFDGCYEKPTHKILTHNAADENDFSFTTTKIENIYHDLEAIKLVAISYAKEHGVNYNIILVNPGKDGSFDTEKGSTYEFVRDSYFEKERPNVILLHKTDDLIPPEIAENEDVPNALGVLNRQGWERQRRHPGDFNKKGGKR